MGRQYTFLVKSVKKPDISISDSRVLDVGYFGEDARGHLFTLKAESQGESIITASLGGFKDSFTVEVSA